MLFIDISNPNAISFTKGDSLSCTTTRKIYFTDKDTMPKKLPIGINNILSVRYELVNINILQKYPINNTFTPNVGHTYNQTTTAQPTATVDKYYYLPGVTSAPIINNNSTNNPIRSIRPEPYNTNYTLPANIFPFHCTTAIGAGMVAPPSVGGESALTEKEQIAEAMVVYPEFAEGAQWLEERKLYREMDKDTTLANESLILEEFYTDMTNEALGRLEALKKGEKEINDAPLFDYDAYKQKLEQLKTANEQVISIENQEQKEKQINALFYRTVEQGVDSLTEEEQNFVASLAYGCPLVDGEAVFLARAMHQLIDPAAHYNSKEICNNLGYYKTQRGNDDDVVMTDIIDNSYCALYPNPANTTAALNFVIGQNDRLTAKVIDILGREIYTATANSNIGSLVLPTDKWANGNYIIKCISIEGKEYSFKLIVQH